MQRGKADPESVEDGQVESEGWEVAGQKTAGFKFGERPKDGILWLVMTCTNRLKDIFMASYGQ